VSFSTKKRNSSSRFLGAGGGFGVLIGAETGADLGADGVDASGVAISAGMGDDSAGAPIPKKRFNVSEKGISLALTGQFTHRTLNAAPQHYTRLVENYAFSEQITTRQVDFLAGNCLFLIAQL
jgi:hypothetical protein